MFWILRGFIQKHSSSHRQKAIILYFLTTGCRSYFLVKLQVWINHVDTWRRFDDDTRSMQLHIDFVSTKKQLCLSKGMQLYKAINSVKSVFLGFWAMVLSSYTVMWKEFWETLISYSAFCITPFEHCFSLILIVSHSNSRVLQCTAP